MVICISAGATGALHAQICNGAPFQIFLSADRARPEQSERDGRIVAGSRATYACGRLVLWSRDPALVDGKGEVLRRGAFAKLALADPQATPYGLAARQCLERSGLWAQMQDRIVTGSSIAQAHQFVASGAADLGFIALSQLRGAAATGGAGSSWLVDPSLHDPIDQQAVLLSSDPAAAAFLAWLLGPETRPLIEADGYQAPTS